MDVVPLHVVSDHGNATIVQLLIQAGANLDVPTSVCVLNVCGGTCNRNISAVFQRGWTSLMKASFQGHNEVIELLLAAGANTDLKNQVSVCVQNLKPQ